MFFDNQPVRSTDVLSSWTGDWFSCVVLVSGEQFSYASYWLPWAIFVRLLWYSTSNLRTPLTVFHDKFSCASYDFPWAIFVRHLGLPWVIFVCLLLRSSTSILRAPLTVFHEQSSYASYCIPWIIFVCCWRSVVVSHEPSSDHVEDIPWKLFWWGPMCTNSGTLPWLLLARCKNNCISYTCLRCRILSSWYARSGVLRQRSTIDKTCNVSKVSNGFLDSRSSMCLYSNNHRQTDAFPSGCRSNRTCLITTLLPLVAQRGRVK